MYLNGRRQVPDMQVNHAPLFQFTPCVNRTYYLDPLMSSTGGLHDGHWFSYSCSVPLKEEKRSLDYMGIPKKLCVQHGVEGRQSFLTWCTKQSQRQLVPHILEVVLEVKLWIGQILSDLFIQRSEFYIKQKYKEN